MYRQGHNPPPASREPFGPGPLCRCATSPHTVGSHPLHKGAFGCACRGRRPRRPDGSPRRVVLAPEGAIGEGFKSVKKNAALLHFLAFGPFDHLIGVLRGEQPLSWGLRVAHERARFAGWRRSLCAAKRLPRNSETFFASFFGHKKGRTTGSMTLIRAERRKVARSGSANLTPARK